MAHTWTSRGMMKNDEGKPIRWICVNCRAIHYLSPLEQRIPDDITKITSYHDPRIKLEDFMTCEEYLLFQVHTS